MRPGRDPIGGPSYSLSFARTFASGRGSLQSTRRISSGRGSQAPSAEPRTTTVVDPGEPHYFAVRIDRAAARAISTLCRCRNPDRHGDAWAINLPHAGKDPTGRELSWKELSNRVLDYCRKDAVNREEEHYAYQYILSPYFYRSYIRHYVQLNRQIGRGNPVILCDVTDDVQFHGDGHVRNNVTEEGLRTVVNRPGYPGSSGGAGSSRR